LATSGWQGSTDLTPIWRARLRGADLAVAMHQHDQGPGITFVLHHQGLDHGMKGSKPSTSALWFGAAMLDVFVRHAQ
jgi:ABC-type nitrate/sulfonate/bicarbonate transport system substrate-binding protein